MVVAMIDTVVTEVVVAVTPVASVTLVAVGDLVGCCRSGCCIS